MEPVNNIKTIQEVIGDIIQKNTKIRDFWLKSNDWAPIEAANILSKSRLDWQVSLSKSLLLWIKIPSNEIDDGILILAWTNLGALVEGSMKLLLSVYYEDYKADVEIRKKIKCEGDPDEITFEKAKQFIIKRVNHIYAPFGDFISLVQKRRNAIHAFKDKEIGTIREFIDNINTYKDFLFFLDEHLPYP
jgi:hypothetical protein